MRCVCEGVEATAELQFADCEYKSRQHTCCQQIGIHWVPMLGKHIVISQPWRNINFVKCFIIKVWVICSGGVRKKWLAREIGEKLSLTFGEMWKKLEQKLLKWFILWQVAKMTIFGWVWFLMYERIASILAIGARFFFT